MPASYNPGDILGRGQLSFFLEDESGNPTNAAEISYAISFVSVGPPETETVVGPSARVPVNPAVGEYFGSLQIPSNAQPGTYRVRWRLRRAPGYPLVEIVEEFTILSLTPQATSNPLGLTVAEKQLIDRLRILLRDWCVGGEETVELDVAGERMVVRLDELHHTLSGQEDSLGQADRIRQAFGAGQLRVQAVAPNGDVEWKRVEHTHKNPVPWEHIYEHQTEKGLMVSTGGHSVYTSPTTTVLSESLCSGDAVLGAVDGVLTSLTVQKAQRISSRPFMYDLTVEDHQNFILHRSKVVVHNCPDRHYHFNPPEHESQIGQYNRVFGFVWEDLELREYLRSALDTWNMYPPNTAATTPSLDTMLQNRFTSSWAASIMWGAIAYAMFALTRNWIQDEFSIGGEVEVTVYLPDGQSVSLPVEELYEICHGQ